MWLFGEYGGIQVWAAEGDPRVRVSVLIDKWAPVVLLNQRLIGTPGEYESIAWALARVAEGVAGFYPWVV